MATEVVMPQMGYDMTEGTVLKWLRHEGDQVSRGDILAEIETDKATVELESFGSGILRKIVVPEGEMVPVGEVIAFIGTADEALPPLPPRPAAGKARAAAVTPSPSELRVSPIARKLAQERGVDLSRVTGTGPGGRVTERDVTAYLERPPTLSAPPRPVPTATPAEGLVELSRMRQAIARVTSRSKQEIPHYYVTVEVDMRQAMEQRRQLNKSLESQGVHITVNDLIVKACALTLAKFPAFNASFIQGKAQRHAAINIGIAIALEGEGLILPAVLDCAHKSLAEIAKATKDLGERAHAHRLREQEYAGATFSISNLGSLEVDSFAAIILPPQAAMLAVGAVREQPVVRNGQVVAGQTMKATLSADHRLTDGWEAAQFLMEFKRLLEDPATLLSP
ncbi:MAG: 2-oxo acid dehydrogenase subunit E2 [Dehalococcoidia bacterium]|nr:2-oxo acid dehydrogenase subunit E2 [Dehalococcoidia bacterium]